MNKLNVSQWQSFTISELFITESTKNKIQVPTGASIPKVSLIEQENGGLPRITVTGVNNGIIGHYKEMSEPNYRVFENFISISFLGTIFYHPYKASLDMKVHCLKLRNKELNANIALFLIGVIKKHLYSFAYDDQLSSTVLPTLSIRLPIRNDIPDWEYMENFIDNIYVKERDSQYYIDCYIKNTLVQKVDSASWREYSIDELFNIKRPVSRTIKQYETGSIPFVSSGNFNNGIDKFVTPMDNEILDKGNCITISPVDGSCFYQAIDFLGRGGGGSSIILLYNEKLNEKNGLFISAVIGKTLSRFYQYNDMGSSASIRKEKIKLPVKNDVPDWEYMEQFIDNLYDKEREKTKTILSMH
ncbi:restriction endonuclease subunit S [Lonepinella koalarum]|uniref:Type I restriction modification DNA specificity protein n=1 Tax=Lonepinella koalarum TaxID=53417 RepID=A0A4R1KZH4_9PAST|nr:restriction endonuclease subunit S [Lonepinella koalarum]TCK69943.1 type I restriction modification DNA specificity protein [Lonepinella koalarum]